MINVIAAISRNRALGYNGNLIYHIKEDLKRFKSLTTSHTVIMGRKTFESLPNGALPNRRNIVITRQNVSFENTETVHSLDDALAISKNDREVFIIGGASIYKEAIDKGIVERFYMTEVEDVPIHADVFFPEIPYEYDVKFASVHTAENNLIYSFVDYEKEQPK